MTRCEVCGDTTQGETRCADCRHWSEYPLVAGGQGRLDGDVAQDGEVLVVYCAIGIACAIAITLLWWLS